MLTGQMKRAAHPICHGGDLSWLQLKSTRKSPQRSKQSKLPLCCLIDLVITITISSAKVRQIIWMHVLFPKKFAKDLWASP
jgi:hypothetical protein